jgi:hypothetical protein
MYRYKILHFKNNILFKIHILKIKIQLQIFVIDTSGRWVVCKSPYFIYTIRYPLESITDIFMCTGWGSAKILNPSKAASGNAAGHMVLTPHHMLPGSARSATLSHQATRNPATFVILRLHKAVGFVSTEPQWLSFCVLKRGHKGYYYYY